MAIYYLSTYQDQKDIQQKVVDGVKGYWDKFDEIFITFEAVEKLVLSMNNLPKYYRENTIKDIKKYTQECIDNLNLNWENNSRELSVL